jgi:cytoskeletal protein CcmA (bactofilin family)
MTIKEQQTERGDVLVAALIVMAVGALLLIPLLAHLGSSYRTTQRVEQSLLDQYDSEAGVEYALWKLRTDASFRERLQAGFGSEDEWFQEILDLPEGGSYEVTVAQVAVMGSGGGEGSGVTDSRNLPWAIWANRSQATDDQEVYFNGGGSDGHTIYGGVHSNGGIHFQTSKHTVYGPGEYVTAVSAHAADAFTPDPPVQVSPSDFPIRWYIEDFRPDGELAIQAAAQGAYHAYEGDCHFTGNGSELPTGLYYCAGDAHLTGNSMHGVITLAAEGQVKLSSAGQNFTPYLASGLTFFSNRANGQNDIDVTGSGNAGGTLFAPYGEISVNGSGNVFTGSLYANTVEIIGGEALIQLPQPPVDPSPGGGDGGSGGQAIAVPWAVWTTSTSSQSVYITGNKTTINGEVHSNGGVYLGANEAIFNGDVHSNGAFYLNRNMARVYGNVYANNDVWVSENDTQIDGDVYSAGNVYLTWNLAKILGQVSAAGNVELKGNNSVIAGPVHAQGNLLLNWQGATVKDDVWVNGSVQMGGYASRIEGVVRNGGSVTLNGGAAAIIGDIYSDGSITLSGYASRIQGRVENAGGVALTGGSTRIEGDLHSDGPLVSVDAWAATIQGNVYTNGTVYVRSGASITGSVYPKATPKTPETAYVYSAPELALTPPISWNLSDFAPGGVYALEASDAYHYHAGNWSVTANLAVIEPGLHYVAGNVTISANQPTAENVTIVAEGTINISSNMPVFGQAYIAGVSLFSNATGDSAITISSNRFQCLGGIIYAPRGAVLLSGNKPEITGAFLAERFRSTSNEATIGVPPDLTLPDPNGGVGETPGEGGGDEGEGGEVGGGEGEGDPGEGQSACAIYDVRSISGGVTTTVRVRSCSDDSDFEVLVWSIE